MQKLWQRPHRGICAACGQREGRGELRSSEALAGFVFMSMLTLALMQHGSIVFSFYRTVDDRSDAILCYYLWLECRGAV